MSRSVRILFILIFAAVVPFCLISGPRNAAAEGKGLKVVVMVYSGRADDPTYQLVNPELVGKVSSLVKKRKKADFKGQTIIPSILGYRGVMVVNQGKLAGMPETFFVRSGMIEVTGKEKRFYRDEGRQLEQLLLKEAKKAKVLDEKLVRQMNIDMLK